MRDVMGQFERMSVDCYLTGSDALAAYGVPRQTLDTDVVLDAAVQDLDRLARALEGMAATTRHNPLYMATTAGTRAGPLTPAAGTRASRRWRASHPPVGRHARCTRPAAAGRSPATARTASLGSRHGSSASLAPDQREGQRLDDRGAEADGHAAERIVATRPVAPPPWPAANRSSTDPWSALHPRRASPPRRSPQLQRQLRRPQPQPS
jgi:hypothetical protein